MASWSVGPGTYSVAIHGRGARVSASTTAAVPAAADRSGHLDLAAEPLAEARVVGQLGAGDLDRHLASVAALSQVDRSHGTTTKPAQEQVVPNALWLVHLHRIEGSGNSGRNLTSE